MNDEAVHIVVSESYYHDYHILFALLLLLLCVCTVLPGLMLCVS